MRSCRLPTLITWAAASAERLRLLALADRPRQVVDVESERRGHGEQGRERRVAGLSPLKSAEAPSSEPGTVCHVLLAQCRAKARTPDVPAKARDEVVELHPREGTASRKYVPGYMIPETCCLNGGTRVPLQVALGEPCGCGASVPGTGRPT